MAIARFVTKDSSGYHVRASGDTSGETDTVSIETAIQAIVADGGGHLWLGPNLWIAGPMMMRNGLQVHGPGWSAPVRLANGANSAMLIATDLDPWFRVENLHLDGRRESQTGGFAAVDVMTKFARNATPKPPASCSWPGFYDVFVDYAYGHSFHLDAVESRMQDCFSFRPGGSGYVLDQTDQFLRTCTSGEAASHGFHVRGSEHQIIHSKAWWSGWQNTRGSAEGKTSYHLKSTTAADFRIEGGSHQLTAIHAQDGVRYGIELAAGSSNITGRVGRQGHDGLIDGAHLGLTSGAANNRVDLVIDSAVSNYAGTKTKWMSEIHPAASGNDIRLTGRADPAATTSWTLGGDSGAGGATTGRNTVILGGGGQIIPTPYAASIIPDPIAGGVEVTATGNLTIANPRTDTRGHGMTMEVVVVQDATGGRTVTFGTDYKAVTAPSSTAPNSVHRWSFRCHKGSWVQTASVTW